MSLADEQPFRDLADAFERLERVPEVVEDPEEQHEVERADVGRVELIDIQMPLLDLRLQAGLGV